MVNQIKIIQLSIFMGQTRYILLFVESIKDVIPQLFEKFHRMVSYCLILPLYRAIFSAIFILKKLM